MSTTKKITANELARLLHAVAKVEHLNYHSLALASVGLEHVDQFDLFNTAEARKNKDGRTDWFGVVESFGRYECECIYLLPVFGLGSELLYYAAFLRELFVFLHNKSRRDIIDWCGIKTPIVDGENTTNVQDWCDMLMTNTAELEKVINYMIKTNYNNLKSKI